jgi:hypothetical protein
MAERVFTLDEALTLLPTVRQLVTEIQAARSEVERLTLDLDRLLQLSGGNGHLAADQAGARRAVQAAASKLDGLLSEMESIGVVLKGIDDGLVDFPSEREGRVVNLCWRLGEETIAWWHEMDTGFAGRQPL